MPLNMPNTPAEAMAVMPNMIQNFGVGPATGYQAANQQIASNNLLDLAQQGSQLGLQQQQMNVDKAQKDIPLQDAIRQLQLTQNADQQQLEATGLPLESQKTKLQADIENTNLDAATKKKVAMANQAEEMDNSLGDNSVSIDSLQNPQQGQAIRQQWKAMGFPPLPDDGVEARQKIQQYADWSRNTGARIMANAKLQNETNIANIRANATVQSARERGSAIMYSADQRLAASQQLAEVRRAVAGGPKSTDSYLSSLLAKIDNNSATDQERYTAGILMAAKTAYQKGTTGQQMEGVDTGTKSAGEKAVSDFVTKNTQGTATDVPQKPVSQYSAAQEANIAKVMAAPANKGASREAVIKAMKDAGKL